jgi:hypothetical protein
VTGIVVDAVIFLVVVATYALYKAAVKPLVRRGRLNGSDSNELEGPVTVCVHVRGRHRGR